MTSENPFAVLATGSADEAAFNGVSDEDFTVIDGRWVCCGARVKLPPVCVVTGETSDLVLVSEQLTFRWYRVIVRQHWVLCRYYLSRGEDRRRSRIRQVAFTLKATGILLLLLLLLMGLAEIQIALWLIGLMAYSGGGSILGGVLIGLFAQSGLKIAALVEQRYLIAGFNPRFFTSLMQIPWPATGEFSGDP